MHSRTKKLTKLITTFFYIGYIPYMPGTFGSLAGVLIFLCLGESNAAVIIATIIITFLGFIFSDLAEKVFLKKDPSCVVIDEVSGMLLCYCFVKFTLFNIIAGFVLFRLFDIIKPFYIKQIEKIKGGAGIMLDDLTAGIYVVLVLKATNILIRYLTF